MTAKKIPFKKYAVRLMLLSLLLALGAVRRASADTTDLFMGTFGADDQVELFGITVSSTETVTFQSYGYAGGTVNSVIIAAGGFAPVIYLFDPTGNEIATDSGGHCGTTGTDPITGNCDDPYLQETLDTGTYTLAVAEWDNAPNDSLLGDGFVEDGNPGFTCAEFGLTGNFCDVTTALGTQRTGNYALAITGADSATDITNPVGTPEPNTSLLILAAVLFSATLCQLGGKSTFRCTRRVQ
jgi:hypothetical protein